MTDKVFIYEEIIRDCCWAFYFYATGEDLRNYLKSRFQTFDYPSHSGAFYNTGNVVYGLETTGYKHIGIDCGVLSYDLRAEVLEFLKMCEYKIVCVDGMPEDLTDVDTWRKVVMDQLEEIGK